MKRGFDTLIALVGLIALTPVMALIAIWIKLDSRGPVLFKQVRMGRGVRPFSILKFRTMVVDAPKLGGEITPTNDPRITRVGRLLRKSKLDELPQLWNVLVGEMSFVGPRPEVPKYVKMFPEEFADLLTVRPGITDPASLAFRDESSILAQSEDPESLYCEEILPQKIALGKEYSRQASLWTDCVWIVKTIVGVVCPTRID